MTSSRCCAVVVFVTLRANIIVVVDVVPKNVAIGKVLTDILFGCCCY